MLEVSMSGSTDTLSASGPSPDELVAFSMTRQQYSANGVNDGYDNFAHWQFLDGHVWNPSWQMFTPYACQQPHLSFEGLAQTNPWPMAADARTPAGTGLGGDNSTVQDQWVDQYGLHPGHDLSSATIAGPGEYQIPRSLDPRLLGLDATQFGLDDYGGATAAPCCPIPPTHFDWRQDPNDGTSPSDFASALILPEHVLRQPGQADLGHDHPAPQAARELWTNAEDDEVRSFIYWDWMLSWDRIGGIMHEADFPTRSTEQYMERHEAIRGAGWRNRRRTSFGLDGPDGEAPTPWTIEEEHHLTNAVNIVRRSVFRRVRDEMPCRGYSRRSVWEYTERFG
ncbi:hypothetical protein Q7P37_009852 [Cladosporium fusiforme]